MFQYEKISTFCEDPRNADALKAAEIFIENYESIVKEGLNIPHTPAEPVDINDVLGHDIEESIGDDIVIFDVLYKNRRTVLYLNNLPDSNAIMIYSAVKNKFQSNAVYEQYTPENEAAYNKAVKDAFTL